MSPKVTRFAGMLVVVLCIVSTGQGAIVWDYGPTTGVLKDIGSIINDSRGQNLADSVLFSSDQQITGFNLFTGHAPGSTTFRVKLYEDNGADAPGQLVTAFNIERTDWSYYGLVTNDYGYSIPIYQVSLDFAPILLTGDTKYWIGAAGYNFDSWAAAVAKPGDGNVAVFNGEQYNYNTKVWVPGGHGDLMFQLEGPNPPAVPEPATLIIWTVLGAGAAGFALRRRRDTGRWSAEDRQSIYAMLDNKLRR